MYEAISLPMYSYASLSGQRSSLKTCQNIPQAKKLGSTNIKSQQDFQKERLNAIYRVDSKAIAIERVHGSLCGVFPACTLLNALYQLT